MMDARRRISGWVGVNCNGVGRTILESGDIRSVSAIFATTRRRTDRQIATRVRDTERSTALEPGMARRAGC